MISPIAAELLHEHKYIDRLTLEIYRDLLNKLWLDCYTAGGYISTPFWHENQFSTGIEIETIKTILQ